MYPIRYVPVHATVFGVEIPLLRIYSLNPLVRFVGASATSLYDLRFPPLFDLLYIVAVGDRRCSSSACGCSRKLDRRLAEEV